MQYDNSKSKIHKYQKRLLSKYKCKLDLHDTFKLLMLRKDFFKAQEVFDNYRGRGNKSYSEYVKACNKLKVKAEKLGLTVSNPVAKTKDIQTRIVTILGIGGLIDIVQINCLLIAMKIIVDTNIEKTQDNLANNTNLPVGEKERLKLLKEAQLQKELIAAGVEEEDDDWLDLGDDLNIRCDKSKDIEEYPKTSIKDILLQMEQQKIDYYNSQI